ncbi:cysteine dioxygenase family protein [Nocardioides sp. CFH 31398]|uniref:cysteine dioxygenase n=1 Tax=Nocardioides sp. CFH 31398 TaxID=2919579 RepID=UPI001F05969F|nr:cysteine dioxygenase family protein [Nocardioides sp. CFH 31398]MCH1865004.1 cysteine dioxygenase family protein [Nocardioides sp. CFH 31398]
MTLAPTSPGAGTTPSGAVLGAEELPAVPPRVLGPAELEDLVRDLAARPEVWAAHARHDTGGRHYVSLFRDAHVDVWLLCWNTVDDTGWHDHDTSSGAVAVTRGAVTESKPRLGGQPEERTAMAGASFSFGPDHIHRMVGAVDGSVSIHAYSPPLWRMGQYSISSDGVMRRWSVSYADELRPLD